MAKKKIVQIVLAIGFILTGVLGMDALTADNQHVVKKAVVNFEPVVQTIEVKTGKRQLDVKGEGIVRPLNEISLVPQVSGKVVYGSPSLVNGGEFKKGDVLLRINPIDYRLAVTLAEANIKDAEGKLKVAEEQTAAAREEWRLLHKGAKKEESPPPLVAKEPQLRAARAVLKATKADLERAKLSLQRTELKAPFDGRVSQKKVDVGQYVSAGEPLATLFSTEAAEISVPMDDEDVFWFSVPGFNSNDKGARAVVHARIGGHDSTWSGEVVRSEGEIDERTRMINVVIRVNEPYRRMPPLAAGLFVRVDIEGRTLENAAVIPRSALREDNVVWVADKEGRLRFRKVQVARINGDMVTVEAGLKEGERVIVSPISVVTDGMAVRTSPVDWGTYPS